MNAIISNNIVSTKLRHIFMYRIGTYSATLSSSCRNDCRWESQRESAFSNKWLASLLSELALSHTLMVIYELVVEPQALIACNLYAWVISKEIVYDLDVPNTRWRSSWTPRDLAIPNRSGTCLLDVHFPREKCITRERKRGRERKRSMETTKFTLNPSDVFVHLIDTWISFVTQRITRKTFNSERFARPVSSKTPRRLFKRARVTYSLSRALLMSLRGCTYVILYATRTLHATTRLTSERAAALRDNTFNCRLYDSIMLRAKMGCFAAQ